jgi:tRNA pseudouridine55 synthase
MDGILTIHKQSGMTSHDVVQAVRRIVKEKRVGHTGTLDPMATGVLVLCIGKATRIAQYLEAGEKEYEAVMRLGQTTDTLDAEGRVLETRTYIPPDRAEVLKALEGFTGAIMQQPPVYSALKVAGVPSYKLARQGKAAPLKPREVTIFSIDLQTFEDPLLSLAVRCSKGVYIRTLCADLGEVLQAGAHLTKLVRTRSGRFTLSHAVTLDRLAELAASGALDQVLVSMDDALADFPSVTVSELEADRIQHGNSVPWQGESSSSGSLMHRIHDPSGRLLALGRPVRGDMRPELVFS